MKDWYYFCFEQEYTPDIDTVEINIKVKGKFKNRFMITVNLLDSMGIKNIDINSIHGFKNTHYNGDIEFLSGRVTSIENGIVEFEILEVDHE